MARSGTTRLLSGAPCLHLLARGGTRRNAQLPLRASHCLRLYAVTRWRKRCGAVLNNKRTGPRGDRQPARTAAVARSDARGSNT
jgi:hypothetical protein